MPHERGGTAGGGWVARAQDRPAALAEANGAEHGPGPCRRATRRLRPRSPPQNLNADRSGPPPAISPRARDKPGGAV